MGSFHGVVVPLPSWPKSFPPQHWTPPAPVSAQLWLPPPAMATTPLPRPTTSTGVVRCVVDPSPSWPPLLFPQHLTPPADVSAQAKPVPAAIDCPTPTVATAASPSGSPSSKKLTVPVGTPPPKAVTVASNRTVSPSSLGLGVLFSEVVVSAGSASAGAVARASSIAAAPSAPMMRVRPDRPRFAPCRIAPAMPPAARAAALRLPAVAICPASSIMRVGRGRIDRPRPRHLRRTQPLRRVQCRRCRGPSYVKCTMRTQSRG